MIIIYDIILLSVYQNYNLNIYIPVFLFEKCMLCRSADRSFIYVFILFFLFFIGAVYGMPPMIDRYGMALPMGPATMVGLKF